MRMKLAAAVALIALSLSACGPGGVGGSGLLRSGPSESDLAQALLTRHPGHPIVAAKLNECREEKVDGKTQQACGFCFVAVGLSYSDNVFSGGAYLRAVRRSGNIVFQRPDSADQSGGKKESDKKAGWVASRVRHDASIESAPLTDDMMSRAGHHRRPGFGTFVRWTTRRNSSLGRLGEVDEQVARTLASDAKLRSEAAGLVGACERADGQWKGRPRAASGTKA